MTKDSAKTILCYGDSNTWGSVPRSDARYPRSIRWTSVLENLLGDGYEVISEGLCGRTFVAENPAKPHRTGITHLQSILESADPIDQVIIMLGTSDIKTTYRLTPTEIAAHLLQTIKFIQNPKNDLVKIPQILIVCPPPVIIPATHDLGEVMADGPEKFKVLPALYKEVAEKNGCDFMNAGDFISSSMIDGYHLDKEGHIKFAEAVRKFIK